MHERVNGIVRYFLVTVVALFLILGCIILYVGFQKATLKKAEARRETKIYAGRIEALLNSLFPVDGIDYEQLMKMADERMYTNKQSNKNS